MSGFNRFTGTTARQSFALSSSKRSIDAVDSTQNEDGTGSESSLEDEYEIDQYTLKRRDEDDVVMTGSDTTELKETNIGMMMLVKIGWRSGTGLGSNGQGRLEPVPSANNYGSAGIGKERQDVEMLDSTTLGPRQLESQRIAKETVDQKLARQQRASYQETLKSEIKTTLRSFHCDICNKGYSNISQYDEHTNSYDHHHQARAKATQLAALERKRSSGETDKRREKERKREEQQLQKLMGAAGVKPVKTATVAKVKIDEVPMGKKGGWNPVGASTSSGFAPIASTSTQTPAVKTGWSTIGSTATSTPTLAKPAASAHVTSFQSAGYLSPDLMSSVTISAPTIVSTSTASSNASTSYSSTTKSMYSVPSHVSPPKSQTEQQSSSSISRSYRMPAADYSGGGMYDYTRGNNTKGRPDEYGSTMSSNSGRNDERSYSNHSLPPNRHQSHPVSNTNYSTHNQPYPPAPAAAHPPPAHHTAPQLSSSAPLPSRYAGSPPLLSHNYYPPPPPSHAPPPPPPVSTSSSVRAAPNSYPMPREGSAERPSYITSMYDEEGGYGFGYRDGEFNADGSRDGQRGYRSGNNSNRRGGNNSSRRY